MEVEQSSDKRLGLKRFSPQDYEGMWAYFQSNGRRFFETVEIARDGGFSDVAEIFGVFRYVTVALTIFFMVNNVHTILEVNLPVIARGDPSLENSRHFTVTTSYILTPLLSRLGSSSLLGTLPDDVFVISCFEISLLLWHLVCVFKCLLLVATMGRRPHRKWNAVRELFWRALPPLSTTSGMRLLNCVTPAVFLPRLLWQLENFGSRGGFRGCLALLHFLQVHFFLGLMGFDALLLKVQIVSGALNQNLDSPGDIVRIALSFLSQLLGIVQLSLFVRQRIFTFVFGGEDSFLSLQEAAVQETWEAMLARRIWTEPTLAWHQKLALSLSFSEADLQQLVLETVARRKGKKHS